MEAVLGFLGSVAVLAVVLGLMAWWDYRNGGGPDIDNTGPGGGFGG